MEETASLKRKVERAKKFEMADRADEVLMEEIKEYKDILTCPSCKVSRCYICGWSQVYETLRTGGLFVGKTAI